MEPPDDAFRDALRELLERTYLSARGLSAAMGRDPGYVSALLDPTRPSRARPTPADLMRASDATGVPLVDLLERLWAIPRDRLGVELSGSLTWAERELVADLIEFLERRRARPSDSSDPERVRRGVPGQNPPKGSR